MEIDSEPLVDLSPKKNNLELALWLVIVLLMVADFATTYIGINYYGLMETNIFLNEAWTARNYDRIIQFEIFGVFGYFSLYIFFGNLWKKYSPLIKLMILGVFITSCLYAVLNNLLWILH